jgi:hypothetical protein
VAQTVGFTKDELLTMVLVLGNTQGVSEMNAAFQRGTVLESMGERVPITVPTGESSYSTFVCVKLMSSGGMFSSMILMVTTTGFWPRHVTVSCTTLLENRALWGNRTQITKRAS